MLDKLLHSSKFWFSVYALAQAIIAYAAPNFPNSIKTAIDALVAVVIAAWAVDEAQIRTSFERSLAPSPRFPRAFEVGLAVGIVLLLIGLFVR